MKDLYNQQLNSGDKVIIYRRKLNAIEIRKAVVIGFDKGKWNDDCLLLLVIKENGELSTRVTKRNSCAVIKIN